MKDKEKQIEEIARVLSTVKRCEALALSECIKKKCEYPHYEGVTCIAEHQAKALYEQGYRKESETAERKEEIKQIQQETAKDILDEVSKYFGGKWLVELYKKYGLSWNTETE